MALKVNGRTWKLGVLTFIQKGETAPPKSRLWPKIYYIRSDKNCHREWMEKVKGVQQTAVHSQAMKSYCWLGFSDKTNTFVCFFFLKVLCFILQCSTPRRGIEPRSSAWQAEILSTILTRKSEKSCDRIQPINGLIQWFFFPLFFLPLRMRRKMKRRVLRSLCFLVLLFFVIWNRKWKSNHFLNFARPFWPRDRKTYESYFSYRFELCFYIYVLFAPFDTAGLQLKEWG